MHLGRIAGFRSRRWKLSKLYTIYTYICIEHFQEKRLYETELKLKEGSSGKLLHRKSGLLPLRCVKFKRQLLGTCHHENWRNNVAKQFDQAFYSSKSQRWHLRSPKNWMIEKKFYVFERKLPWISAKSCVMKGVESIVVR